MPEAHALGIGTLFKALERVLPDDLEHREPWLGACDRLQQALLGQRRQSVDDLEREFVLRIENRFGRFDGACAREHRQAREQRSLVAAEQVVAPVESRAHRALAIGAILRSAGEQPKPPVEPIVQVLRREHAQTRRCQLQRERQTVEPHADLADCRRVLAGEFEVGSRSLSALDKERDRVEAQQRFRMIGVARSRKRQRRHRKFMLTREVKGRSTCREYLEVPGRVQQVRDEWRGVG